MSSGRRLFEALLAGADILVENFSPSQASAMDLDYPSLVKINPTMVLTSITPFGQTGPGRA